MKILAFTDMHGNADSFKKIKKKAERADLIICAGDFTYFESRMEKILAAMDKLGKKVLLIHGNHEDERNVEKACGKMKNIVFLHKKAHRFNDYLFTGFGGMGFSQKDDEFEKYAQKFENKKKIILVTHAPPYNTKLDNLFSHNGNKSITSFIKKAKPILAICGHFHELFGKKDMIKTTLIINPGPEGRIIKIE